MNAAKPARRARTGLETTVLIIATRQRMIAIRTLMFAVRVLIRITIRVLVFTTTCCEGLVGPPARYSTRTGRSSGST